MRPLSIILAILALVPSTRGFARRAVRWNVAGTTSRAPLAAANRVLLVNGPWIRCHDLNSGRQLWAKRRDGLVGSSLVWTGSKAFLLAKGGLFALDMANGNVTRHRALVRPQSLVASATQLVVSDATGISWLDLQGNVTAHNPRRGTLRGLDGQRVVLFVDKHTRRAKRLLVLSPSQAKPLLTFKLLTRGKHTLLRFDQRSLLFADHCGAGPCRRHRIYLTNITLPAGAKRDLSLGKLFAVEQPQLRVAEGGGSIFVTSFGGRAKHRDKTLLVGVDPNKKKVRWKRRGLLLSTGARWSTLGVLVGASREGGTGELKVFDPQTGAERSTQALDAAPMWPPLVAGPCLLVQTHRSLYCLETSKKPAVAQSPAPGGWQLHQDPVVGYKLSIAPSWKLAAKHVRKLGGKRYSLPFVRYRRRGSRWLLQGTMHLLVREAAGQDTEGFWRSVAAFRRRQDPTIRILARQPLVLEGTYRATVARYEMRNRAGAVEQWRSLCLVHRGIAYELRAWAAPLWEQQVWPEVAKMMGSFRPLKTGSNPP